MRACFTMVFVAFFLASCSEDVPPPAVVIQPAKVMTVGEQFQLTREIPGTVRAAQRSELSFQVAGQIVELDVKEGQEVVEGAVLGRLNDSDYQSAVNAAVAERDKNKSNFERAKELIVDNFISQVDFDRTKAAFDISTANLERAEKALADTRLVAPFSGVIAKTLVENFEDVQAKQPILSLQSSGELEIVVALSETLVARREEGANIEVFARFDALPDRQFELFIKEFAAEADPQTQTFEVVVGLADKNVSNILPGMTATVNVTRTDSDENAGPLVVPLVAVVAGEGDAASVWKVNADNKVQKQVVVTGQLVGEDEIEISSGLTMGDIIVTAGISSLTDGKEITPITELKY
jgi:RND family efflux transporter MFP subunit